ncbi:alkylation response protein AidB-like acyl-CoA dehydrogenase [Marinobacterium halophilum]|uniref:Alkylation response protein AidB-like acyl-CoA dehydrogenase n=1 Tax=Marinobacterium halophilum TaxID=267374 RepID=A0A2P8F2E9_9GAMM|nr:acyl-CoA dehydrogenase family protein [Marinobacterium halophilum]PSL15884.1 alkylation response protein AidB-like acyl-CoA dehydrogenase [Marinobacterium halophilum]
MEFRFTEEQQMIRDTAESFFADCSTSAAVREAMVTETGYSPQLWQQICNDLYLHAITLPEALGGMGLGYVELVSVMEQMGRYLVCAPYFSTVCQALPALQLAGSEAQVTPWLERVLAGETAALAWIGHEQPGCDAVTARFIETDDGYCLTGDYQLVVDGHSADMLVLAARREGSSGRDGISLFVVDAATAGIERHWTPTLDQTRHLGTVRVDTLQLPANACLGEAGHSGAVLEQVLQLATVALAAEQMGAAQQVQDLAVAYTKEREQFGRPVAGFQAIKHKAADMMLRTEVSRSACYYAACIADEAWRGGTLAAELPEAVAIAKSYCSDACLRNAGEALQMHGGVGFTWEYDVHLYFKRAKSSELMLGSASEHREALAALLLDQEKPTAGDVA